MNMCKIYRRSIFPDVNCHLKVKFKDAKQKDMFFSSFEELQDIADAEL